tara:strand:+ start:1278 stop:3803 length:2526 start_codon:yes stop_codon:yes gene_type:complete
VAKDTKHAAKMSLAEQAAAKKALDALTVSADGYVAAQKRVLEANLAVAESTGKASQAKAEAIHKEKALLESFNEAQSEATRAKEKATEASEREQKQREAATKALELETAALNRLTKGSIEYTKQLIVVETAQADVNKTTEQTIEQQLEERDARAANTKTLKEQTEELDKTKKAQGDFQSALGRTIKTYTGVTTGSETLIGSFFKMRKEAGKGGEAQKDFRKSMEKMFDSMNVGQSIISKVLQSTKTMALANDTAVASFNKSTGAAGHYDAELIALEQQNRHLGISTADSAESQAALLEGLSGFGVMAQSSRMELASLGSQFAAMGVSSSDYVGSLETMTRGLGMSEEAAMDMTKQAMSLAQTLGKSVSSVMKDLNQVLPKLATYGRDVEDMFADLERQAQRTGIEVGSLVDIAGRYRTFDDAATAAGNLNAVLDTQVFSSMGMLEANLEGPEQLIEYMTENLHNSVGDWETLSTYQKDAVANAAGMSAQELNQLMNAEALTDEQVERNKSIDETLSKTRDLAAELKILMAEFAIAAEPVIEVLKTVIGWMINWIELGKSVGSVFGGVGEQIGAIVALIGIALVAAFVKAIAKGAIMTMTIGSQTTAIGIQTTAVYNLAAAWRAAAMARSAAQGGGGFGQTGGQIGPARSGNVMSARRSLNPPAAKTGMFARGTKMGMGLGFGASILGAQIKDGEGGGRDKLGGALQGAAMGGMVFGAPGAVVGGLLGGLGVFHEGGGVGGAGDVPAMVQGGEAIVPIERTPAAEVFSTMVAEKSAANSGDNTEVVAAVNAITAKLDSVISALKTTGGDTVMEVDGRAFGRLVNGQTGASSDGYRKQDIKVA